MYAKEISMLRRIVALAEKLIEESPKPRPGRPVLRKKDGTTRKRGSGKRIRRTGKELLQFRKMLKVQRKRGVPVAKLARKHGISPAYIYMLS